MKKLLTAHLRRLHHWYRGLSFVPQLLVFQAGAAAVLALPAVGYRIAQGDLRQAAINTAIIVAVVLAALVGARRTERVAGLLFAGTYVLAAWLIAVTRGALGAYWSFPVACAIFFVLRAREAWVVNAITAGICGYQVLQARGDLETLVYLSTYALVALFSARYAAATRDEARALQAQAHTDPLTGLRNRRQLEADLAVLLEAARRPGGRAPAMSLAMIDIDHFKRINDGFGHAVGDAFLQRLPAVIERELDLHHRLYRYGGEEFVVLLMLDAADARADLERAREAVAASRLLRELSEPITISLGLAPWRPGLDAAAWIDRADRALYASKAQGRNRLTLQAQ